MSELVEKAKAEVTKDFDRRMEAIAKMTEEGLIFESIVLQHPDVIDMERWGGVVDISTRAGSINGVLATAKVDSYMELLPLFEHLEDAGLPVADNVEDYPDLDRRTFSIGKRCRLLTFPRGEESTCRAVPTGEMTPVMKIVCGG